MANTDDLKTADVENHFDSDSKLASKSNFSSPQFVSDQSFAGTHPGKFIDFDALPSAPDGGYGWAVVFAAFLHSFFIDGISNSFSLFLPIFREHFQSSVAVTSFIGSTLIGCYHIIGPFVSGLVNTLGCRKVVIIGAVIASAAFTLSVYSPSVYFFMLTYGILGGIGFGLIYLPSIICLSFYFEKKRAVATGLAVAGSGVGTFVMPIIISNLIFWFGWKYTLYFLAVFSLSCLFYGLLYRPLGVNYSKNCRVIMEMDAVPGNINSNVPVILKSSDNENLTPKRPLTDVEKLYRRADSSARCRAVRSHSVVPQEQHTSNNPLDGSVIFGHGHRDLISRVSLLSYTRSISHISQNHQETHSLVSVNCAIGVNELFKPLNRNDIFYQGSTHKLHEYEKCSMRNYKASRISIPTDVALQSLRHLSIPDSKNCLSCSALESVLNRQSKSRRIYNLLPQPIKSALETMDFSLIKEPFMVILLLSNLFGMQAFYIPFMFVRHLAVGKEVSLESAELLLPLIGLSNTLGRVVFGWLADRGWISPLIINAACLFVCGILCIICPWLSSFISFLIYALTFGFVIAAFSCLPSIILTQLLGIKRLTNSFGLLIVSRGIAALVGSPIGGFIYDITGSYNATFCFAGSLFIVSGLFSCLIPFIPRVLDNKSHIIELMQEEQEKVDDHEKSLILTGRGVSVTEHRNIMYTDAIKQDE